MNKEPPVKGTHSSLQNVFWTCPSTWAVTALRLVILFLVQFGAITTTISHHWLYSPALISILIKPSWTLSHVQEALAIQRLVSGHFVDSYQGQRIQLPPLLLAAILPWAQSPYAKLNLGILCLFLDLAIAFMIEYIGRVALFTNRVEAVDKETKEQEQLPEVIQAPYRHIFAITQQDDSNNTALIPMESLPLLAAQFYYWSPISIVSGSVFSCFQNLAGFFLVATFWEAVRKGGSPWLSTFYLALATYLELHHVAFLIPLLSILQTRAGARQPSSSKSFLACVPLSFAIWWGFLHGLSYLLVVPSFVQVLQVTYGLGWKSIRPSLSVQWYLAIQLFLRFRGYFETLLLGLPYIVIVPVTLRLYKYPLVQVCYCYVVDAQRIMFQPLCKSYLLSRLVGASVIPSRWPFFP